MDASQYKDYVLFMLFIKYISDNYADSDDFAPSVVIPKGASFKDMAAQFGQCCMSMSTTRWRSRAQPMRPGRPWAGSASHSVMAAASVASSGRAGLCGITSARSLAFGASTSWFAQRGSAHFAQRSRADSKRIRYSLGRGTSAARRLRSCAAARTAACRLKPLMSAHRGGLCGDSRGITPRRVSALCPAHGPEAVRSVKAAAFNGRRGRASSASASGSAS